MSRAVAVLVAIAGLAWGQGDVFSSNSGGAGNPPARRRSATTGTQTTQPCEAPTNQPGGTRGRTTRRTGTQNPWTNPRPMDCGSTPLPVERPLPPAGNADQQMWSGELHCRAGEAFVGLRLARAAAIDFLQIACAKVECREGRCRWQQALGGQQVGNPHGGGGGIVSFDMTIDQTCANDSVVTGLRASTTLHGNYIHDIQLQCKPMDGRFPNAYINGVTVTAVQNDVTAVPASRRDPATGRNTAIADATVSSACAQNGATGLRYTIGKYGAGIPVVQSVSVLCASGGSTSCPAADPTLTPTAKQLRTDETTLGEMGQAAVDHFFLGVSDTLIGTLEWLAQPCENGGAIGSTAQQFLYFFTLPEPQRNSTLGRAAQEGWSQFTSDPARFFGQQAPNAVPLEKGVDLAKSAAANLKSLNVLARQFGVLAAELKATRFNPARGDQNCFAVAIAYDRARARGHLYQASPTGPVNGQVVMETLRQTYGRMPVDPRHGPLSVLAHRLGIPFQSSKSGIAAALRGAAEADARGLVFVREPGRIGHVFNVIKKDGEVYFFDAQAGLMEKMNENRYFFPQGSEVWFYRTN